MEPKDPLEQYPNLSPLPIPPWFFRQNNKVRWYQEEDTGDWKLRRITWLASGFRYVKKIKGGRHAGQWKVRFRWWKQRSDGMSGRKPDYEFDRNFRDRMAAAWVANLVRTLLRPDLTMERGALVDSRVFCDSIVFHNGKETFYYLYVFGDERRPSIRVSKELYYQVRFIPLFWRNTTKSKNGPQAVYFLVADRKDEGGIPKISVEWVPLQTLFVEEIDHVRPGWGEKREEVPTRLEGSDPRDYRPQHFTSTIMKPWCVCEAQKDPPD